MFAFALHNLRRAGPKSQDVNSGEVIYLDDEDEFDRLVALGAVRKAKEDEVIVYKAKFGDPSKPKKSKKADAKESDAKESDSPAGGDGADAGTNSEDDL